MFGKTNPTEPTIEEMPEVAHVLASTTLDGHKGATVSEEVLRAFADLLAAWPGHGYGNTVGVAVDPVRDRIALVRVKQPEEPGTIDVPLLDRQSGIRVSDAVMDLLRTSPVMVHISNGQIVAAQPEEPAA